MRLLNTSGDATGRILFYAAVSYLEKVVKDYELTPLYGKFIMDLKFLKMFLWGSIYWEESEHDEHVSSIITWKLVPELYQIVYKLKEQEGMMVITWESWDLDDLDEFKECKRLVRESCILSLGGGGTLKCNSFQHNRRMILDIDEDAASFADYILENLKALLESNIDLISSVKSQITFIQGKLEEFSSCSVNYSKTKVKKLREFIFETETWICYISRLVCLYWIDGMNRSFASTTETLFSSLMNKIMPYTPGVIASYVESTMIPQLFASYFDFLLEDIAISIKGEVEILRQGLIFLVSFVMDPPEEDSDDKEQILAQINVIINALPSLIALIRANYEMKGGAYKPIFSGFLQKIDGVKAKVRELCVLTPDSSQLNSPTTHPIGFLELLVRTMQTMLEEKVNIFPSIKHHIKSIQKQLELLKPFLLRHISLQDGHREFKDLWTRTIDVLYHASYVTNICLAKSCTLWYGIVSLLNVLENIKLIKVEFRKIEDSAMYKNKILCIDPIDSSIAPPPQSVTKSKEIFIGFKTDVELVVKYLIRGRTDLTIISISGMPGQGKTTLARKIYDDTRIRLHFGKIVWCYVSKECKDRELLIRIGSELLGPHVKNLEAADIANDLRKSLKKQRYLIVMDDIWDVALWYQVQISFPDDRNGSRILFTSRNHDLASQTGLNYVSHPLPLFSEEESWELMQEKLFSGSSESAPLEFLEAAKQVVRNCKGLPLAVAMIASLLQRNERKLVLWNEVAENLKSHLDDVGCMNVIELSYKYLPEHLKPCFLYFGVFPRGERVVAGRLKRLWKSEGFIKDDGEMQYSEEALAKEYLDYLVSQNLVTAVERGPLGEIKRCNLHDLLYDLCLEKAKEENFINWTDEVVVDHCSSGSQSLKYNHHRLSIRPLDPFIKSKPICIKMGVPISRVHSLLWPTFHAGRRLSEFSFGIFKSLKILTVLDLEGVVLPCEEFPKFLLSLIRLRYLALCFRSEFVIDGVPTSITDLCNLETLLLRAWRGFNYPLPVSMWNMKRLAYVDVPDNTLLHTSEQINNSSLTRLGTLCLFDDCKTEELFRKLPRLRKLKCSSLKIQKEVHGSECVLSMFGSLKQLESLHLLGLELPASYERCSLLSFSFPENLKKLSLSKLRLPWSALSAIAKQLPNLLTLKLLYKAFEGSSWTVEDGDFPKLRYLSLKNLKIEEIDVSACDDNPFPCLEQFVLWNCAKLEEIPSSFGEIATLSSIRIEISSHKKLKESVGQILENQRDLGNDDLKVYFTMIKEDDE